MTLKVAVERANAVWNLGKPLDVHMESIGSGAYVFVDGDKRTHRLDRNGHVTCNHDDCLEHERVAAR